MSMAEVRGLEGLYRAAVEARGAERNRLFHEVTHRADDFAAKYIYAKEHDTSDHYKVGYCNLAHNFDNALMVISGLEWRQANGLFERQDGPPYTQAEIQANIERCDRVLVENGRSVLELFCELVEECTDNAIGVAA